MSTKMIQKKLSSNNRSRAQDLKGLMNLAEAVILQSLEDIWVLEHKDECRNFFGGDGFKIYAGITRLDTITKLKILHLLGGKGHERNIRVH